MRKKLLLFILFSFLVYGFFIPSAWTLRVSPVEFDLKIPPGKAETLTFSVMNDTSEPQIYFISVADWYRDEEGDNLFFEEATPPEVGSRSCRNWIDISPARFEIPPRSTREVRFSLKVPPEARGTYWAIIFVEGAPRPTQHRGYTLLVVPRIGIKVYQTPAGTSLKQGRVSKMMLKEKNPLSFSLTFENRGNCKLRPEGWMEIKDIRGKTVKKISIPPFPILPGFKRVLEIKDKEGTSLPPGIYQALGIIDYGGESLVAGQVVFRIQ